MTAQTTTPNKPTPSTEEKKASTYQKVLEGLATNYRIVPVLVSLIVICGFFAIQNPLFLTPRNLTNLSTQIATTAILALGLVVVLLVAEIDLAVAGIAAVSAAASGVLVVNQGLPVWLALLIGIVIGALIGLIQGLIVTIFRVPSFIITLGVSLAMQGVLLILLPSTGTVPYSGNGLETIAGNFLTLGTGIAVVLIATALVAAVGYRNYRQRKQFNLPASLYKALMPAAATLVVTGVILIVFSAYRGIPLPVTILGVLLGVMAYVTKQTKFGIALYAVGGNAEGARRTGVNVRRIKVTAFVIVGALAAVGGIIAASRLLSVSPASYDPTLLLEAVAAAVIGGTSLFGGRGTVWAALVGALVIGAISNGMFLINASTQVRLIVEGLVLIAAVIADSAIARNSNTNTK